MKCDEQRPECQRCISKGIKCGGYWREFKWSFKYQPTLETNVEDPFVNQSQLLTPANTIAVTSPSQDSSLALATSPSTESSNGHTSPPTSPTRLSITRDGESSRRRFSSYSASAVSPGTGSALSFTDDLNDNEPIETALRSRRYSTASTVKSTETYTHIPVLETAIITDTTSLLITNWFQQVCLVWSGFDSNLNPNRKLAMRLWRDSELVFSSLQSMSAAFLATRLPQMRRPAVQFMQAATRAIQTELGAIRGQIPANYIPTGLLFSLFCLGTSLCWVDARLLGLPLFKEAVTLLQHSNRCTEPRSKEDVEVLDFFNKSLTYWAMLVSVVSNEYTLPTIEAPPPPPTLSKRPDIDGALHPWTGVSEDTSRLFAQSIRACRAFRYHLMQPTEGDFQSALDTIQEAQRLEEQLLGLEFPATPLDHETGDERTPWVHLAKVAEAYQLASLLQLYQTFPDLVSLRLPLDSMVSIGGDVQWEDWIIPLSLRLVKLLEDIPPCSGSRMMQPLLYISASTAVRYDCKTLKNAMNSSMLAGSADIALLLGLNSTSSNDLPPDFISRTSIEISNARQFILGRLNILENTLPPKPIIMARQLITSVWDAYDVEEPGSTTIHWIDVMDRHNLRTVFG